MDVSGSMKTPLQISEVSPGDENVSRAHSIFRTLINVTKSDRRFDEQIFSVWHLDCDATIYAT
jgi:hypothetical protein